MSLLHCCPATKTSPKVLFIFLSLSTFVSSSSLEAKDFGCHGATFAIEERSLLEVIQDRLKSHSPSSIMKHQLDIQEQVKSRINRPRPVQGLNSTEEERAYAYDPSYTAPQSVFDHKGQVIVAAGARLNPLEKISWGDPLLLIDGDVEEQRELASLPGYKVVLVNGSPFELMKAYSKPIYFDQGARISKKFNCRQVPCVISQKGLSLYVEELFPETLKKRNER